MLVRPETTKIFYRTLNTLLVKDAKNNPLIFTDIISGFGLVWFFHPFNLPFVEMLAEVYKLELKDVETKEEENTNEQNEQETG
jgi:hypothetical protein